MENDLLHLSSRGRVRELLHLLLLFYSFGQIVESSLEYVVSLRTLLLHVLQLSPRIVLETFQKQQPHVLEMECNWDFVDPILKSQASSVVDEEFERREVLEGGVFRLGAVHDFEFF